MVTWYAGVLTIVFVLLGAAHDHFPAHYLETTCSIPRAACRQIADERCSPPPVRTGEGAVGAGTAR